MKSSTKAALLSGLAFPGTGHFFLKRPILGLVFFLPALCASMYIANHVWQRASAIINMVMRGEVALDPDAIARLVSATPAADALPLNIAGWVLLGCWAVGVIDAYRLGSVKDNANNSASNNA